MLDHRSRVRQTMAVAVLSYQDHCVDIGTGQSACLEQCAYGRNRQVRCIFGSAFAWKLECADLGSDEIGRIAEALTLLSQRLMEDDKVVLAGDQSVRQPDVHQTVSQCHSEALAEESRC